MVQGPTQPGSWPGRLLGLAATVLAAVLLLRWAWELARPFLPWLVGSVLVIGIIKVGMAIRRRHW